MSTPRSILKSAGVIGALTAVSRVLGFIRDLIIAAAFGTGIGAEAFVVSFKIPNLLRDLVGEGATNAAFVPALTECRQTRPEDFWKLVNTLFAVMTAALLVLSVLGVVGAPWIVRLVAPGFMDSSDPEKFPLTVHLTRVIFPYILLIGLSALAMGVLNSLKEFTSSAAGPCLLNLSMIVAGFFFEKRYGPMALVIAVLVGGALQLAFQIPPLFGRGFRWASPDWHHPSLKKIGKLLVPRALGSAVYQINVFVDSILASFEKVVGFGGQSALYYSNRLFQLPLAIFGVSLAQALLPTFSEHMLRGDGKAFKETFAASVRTLGLVVLPAAVGLVVWAKPIVRIVFQHGQFDAYSTEITSRALFFYAFGLLSCCLIKVFVNMFYSMQDTRTPVKTMVFSVAVNIALSLVLMRFLKIGGLALASSISATLNAVLLYRALKKRLGDLGEKAIVGSFSKLFLVALGMGVLAFFYNAYVLNTVILSTTLVQATALLAGIGICAAFYFGVVFLFRLR